MSTTHLTIYPYKLHGCWVFDDPRTGLKEEAFVCGATEMISRLVETRQIPQAERGFALSFAGAPFPGHDVELSLLRPNEYGGNWYHGEVAGLRMECWLCPALFCYFPHAPGRIYVRAEPLPAGVSPIWRPPAGVQTRQFIEAPR